MSKRDSIEVRGAQALQVVENPAFTAAFDRVRDNVVNEMERLELTGDNNAHAASLVQKLQAAKEFKAEFIRVIAAADRYVKRDDRADKQEKTDKKIYDPTALPTQPKVDDNGNKSTD